MKGLVSRKVYEFIMLRFFAESDFSTAPFAAFLCTPAQLFPWFTREKAI